MNIAFEQEKKSPNFLGILISATIIAVILGGTYFFLFKKPETIEIILPAALKEVETVSGLEISPEKVLNLEKYKVLRVYQEEFQVPAAGKSNPFMP